MENIYVLPFLFLFFGLLLGTIIVYVNKCISLPYTIIVFIIGFIISVICGEVADKNEVLFLSLSEWRRINPELFLYTFLPALIYAESMTLNYHHVKRVIASSNIIAVPGALLCFYLIALCIKHVLAYSAWDFTLCLVIGSILCASDPVSVINLLKEISTGSNSSIRLTYFIELEALLNDGIALVLFEILTIKHTTVNEYVIYFIRVIFISPLIGIALGLGNIALLHMFQQKISVIDIYIQIVATVICAYLTFFIAQYILGVSGIIACCAAGVTFSYYGKPLILKEELMHGFWGTLEFICNTLIFLLSGLIVGYKSMQYVHYADIGSIFIIYILMNIIRFVTLLICHYPISKLILDYDFRHSIFVAFSGIKGSMSLLLAILLESHTIEDSSDTYAGDKLFPKADVDRAVFVICGVVTCTLVFNGFLMGSVLQWLNLIEKNSEHDDLILSFVKLRLIKESKDVIKSLKHELAGDKHKFVLNSCSILQNIKEAGKQPSISPSNSMSNLASYVRNVSNAELAQLAVSSKDIQLSNNETSVVGANVSNSIDDDGIVVDITRENTSTSIANLANITRQNTNNSLNSMIQLERSYTDTTIIGLNSHTWDSIPKDEIYEVIDRSLLFKFRNVFLQVVRKNYFNQISTGKLPRGSNAALALLNSIDVGLETCHTPGLQDWDAVKHTNSTYQSIIMSDTLSSIMSYLYLESYLVYLRDSHTVDLIHMCLSFIEAHEYAQKKVPYYLGPEDFVNTPEEYIIVHESKELVEDANKLLHSLASKSRIDMIRAKNAAQALLNGQSRAIDHFLEEGILSTKDALYLYTSIDNDIKKLA